MSGAQIFREGVDPEPLKTILQSEAQLLLNPTCMCVDRGRRESCVRLQLRVCSRVLGCGMACELSPVPGLQA